MSLGWIAVIILLYAAYISRSIVKSGTERASGITYAIFGAVILFLGLVFKDSLREIAEGENLFYYFVMMCGLFFMLFGGFFIALNNYKRK
jgi:hypothetical protein